MKNSSVILLNLMSELMIFKTLMEIKLKISLFRIFLSDVRSNWTYYLYLVDLKNDRLTKVKNFNQIKNPHYLPQYNLIDNEVMSGRNWTSFYQIKKDSIFDFGYVVYNGEDDNGNTVDFDKEYDKTLSKILKNKNYN
ncbi:hypothetical protein CHRYSEO8AT_350066 [Chryseobacterium sp. 8AT]|nr:hypothetical protein CHRYSEO8AT_350066 [Chryseobacterium sp. 8AT]